MAPAHFPTDRPNSRQAAPTHLVCNFDKEAESLGGLEEQPGSNVLAEVLGLGAGLHLEGLGRRGEALLALARPLETLWLCLQLDRAPSHARHPSSCMGFPHGPELGTAFKERKRQLRPRCFPITSSLTRHVGLAVQA